jgi:RNA polymerase sigma factor (sigma-70 family)
MDFDQAVVWVMKKKKVIEKKALQYCRYSPYEPLDYLQVAYEASIVAVLRCQTRNLNFEAAFWSVFKTMVRDMTPDMRHALGSNSISSDVCEEVLDIFQADLPHESSCHDNFTGVIYQAVSDRLPPVERETLGLYLGFTRAGFLSKSEIARRRGCSKVSVRQTITRAMERIKRLVDEGLVDPVQVAAGYHGASNAMFLV